MACATATLMKHRFVDVASGDRDGLPTVYVGDRTLVDGFGNRLFDLRLVAAQEALAVNHALVFAVKPSVNEIGHTSPKRRCQLSILVILAVASVLVAVAYPNHLPE
ncbi:hypothetical protein D3C76_1209820 [compost metagenome]